MNEITITFTVIITALSLVGIGAVSFVKAAGGERTEVKLERRIIELEHRLEIMQGERDRLQADLMLSKVRIAQLEHMDTDLQLAQKRIADLEAIVQTYQQGFQFGMNVAGNPRIDNRANLQKQLNILNEQLNQLEVQITAQGGDTHAPVTLTTQRDALKVQRQRIEQVLDGK